MRMRPNWLPPPISGPRRAKESPLWRSSSFAPGASRAGGVCGAPPATLCSVRPTHTSALGGFAKFERELIKARRDEGRKRAIERGVKMGRKAKLTPHQVREAIARRDAREPTREIARSYAVDHATICRLRAAVSNVNCNGPTPLPYAHARSKSGDDHGPRAD